MVFLFVRNYHISYFLLPLKEYLSILASPQTYDSSSYTWTSVYLDKMVNGSY